MTLEKIKAEYRENGRISSEAVQSLRELLRASTDPHDAITVAGDCAVFALATDVAAHLAHPDPMVRWNAATVLFTRFRIPAFASTCLEMVEREVDEIARAAAITGLGELLPALEESDLRKRMANVLLSILERPNELTEMRGAAYEGIQAAVGIPPTSRVPASRLIDPTRDIDPELVAMHKQKFLKTEGP